MDPDVDPGVAEMMQQMNLTEEWEFAAFSDNEDECTPVVAQWAVVWKVLSLFMVHVTTIKGAMMPA